MKVLELFSGTRSIGEAFEKRGHEVFSVEWDESLPADLHADIEFLKAPDVLRAFGRPDVVWASPDCATFSMAGISRHRRKNANTGNLDPVSDYALKCDRVDLAMLRLIRDLRPALYFIENPRAGLRKQDMMAVIPRHTVTYCQYGARAMKPTDIFTNASDPRFCPPCRNGAPATSRRRAGRSPARRAWRTRASAGASPRGCACTSLTCASARCPSERRRAMPVKSAAAAPPGGFTGAGGAAFSSARDDWETPAWLFSALDSEFHFTLDAASSDANAKCERHLTKRDDGLAADWGGERVWVNPPYGRGVGAWARKAAIEGAKPRTTVALLVAARTDTEWFLRYILGHAEIRLVRGRIRFELAGVAQGPAPFPSMVAVFGEGAAPGKVSSIANAAARGGKGAS